MNKTNSIWDAEQDYVKNIHQQIFHRLIENGVIDAEAWDAIGQTCGYILGQKDSSELERYSQVTRVKRSTRNQGILAISDVEKCVVNKPPIESCLMQYLAESEKLMLESRGLLKEKQKDLPPEEDD